MTDGGLKCGKEMPSESPKGNPLPGFEPGFLRLEAPRNFPTMLQREAKGGTRTPDLRTS